MPKYPRTLTKGLLQGVYVIDENEYFKLRRYVLKMPYNDREKIIETARTLSRAIREAQKS